MFFTVKDEVKLVRFSWRPAPLKLPWSWIANWLRRKWQSSQNFYLVLLQFHSNNIYCNRIPTTSPQVIVNEIKGEMAIWAFELQGQLPYNTLYSQIKAARKKGTYNNEIRREYKKKERKFGLLIDVSVVGTNSRDDISPVTMTTMNSSSAGSFDTSSISTIFKTSKHC